MANKYVQQRDLVDEVMAIELSLFAVEETEANESSSS